LQPGTLYVEELAEYRGSELPKEWGNSTV